MEIIRNIISYIASVFMLVTQGGMSSVEMIANGDVFVERYPHIVLETLWIEYANKIQNDGRTLDRSRNYITTSEGQSYSMLRAVWMDDKETFDRVLRWTQNNLQIRPNDELFAWYWGEVEEGRWGVLEAEGGMNSASDADQDIALALIFAHKRWNDEYYLTEAKKVLNSIWQEEVLVLNGKPYLLAGNWAKTEEYPTINPSYLSPAWYPIFAEVDPSHDWMGLRETSYEILNSSTQNNLDRPRSANLPPDWASLNPTTGEIMAPVHDDKGSHFGDDAFRTVWRVALDWTWYQNPKALEYLNSLETLRREWIRNGAIYKEYTHDGLAVEKIEENSMYGATIPYFKITDPEMAKDIYRKKLATLYNEDIEAFAQELGYYDQNWVWFGMAFYQERLPNLYLVE